MGDGNVLGFGVGCCVGRKNNGTGVGSGVAVGLIVGEAETQLVLPAREV